MNILRQPKGFYRSVFAIMIPMVMQNLITQTVALADTFMVGMLGEQLLAATTVATTPLFIFQIFTFGVQSGVSILVAQYWGKGNLGAINRVLGIGVYFALGVTLTGAIALSTFPQQILNLVTNEKQLITHAIPYARIAAFSTVFNSVNMVYISCQRSMENAKLGVVVLASSSVFNVFMNWVLIFGNLGMPALGISGAAIATLCARILELVIISCYAMRNSRLPMKIKLLLRPGVTILKDFIKYSLPVLFNEALWGFGAMLIPIIFGHMVGAEQILAAYTISGNLERMFTVSMFACAGATSVIIGREIGAGRRDTVESVGRSLAALGFIFGLCSGLLLMTVRLTILKSVIFPIFSLSEAAASNAVVMLTIIACVAPLRALGYTMGIGLLRAGGDVKAMMLIDVGTLYLISIPLMAVTGMVLKLGIVVVYSSIMAEDIVKTTLFFFRVRTRKWINDVTREQLE